MTFKENLNRICKERGTNLTQVLKNLGVSTSKVTAINTGSLPKEDLMVALAKELNCSVVDFFVDEVDNSENTNPVQVDYAIFTEDEMDIIEIFREMPREEKHKFLARMYAYREGLNK